MPRERIRGGVYPATGRDHCAGGQQRGRGDGVSGVGHHAQGGEREGQDDVDGWVEEHGARCFGDAGGGGGGGAGDRGVPAEEVEAPEEVDAEGEVDCEGAELGGVC